ncbi:HAD family phosphatase, partial [Candidatus Poribacteria bacterium]|nr:HAD family phosphatase [Candidatus Poribacteria bacterium]
MPPSASGARIRAVLFDLDGTLWPSDPAHAAVNMEVLGRRGVTLSLDEYERRYTVYGDRDAFYHVSKDVLGEPLPPADLTEMEAEAERLFWDRMDDIPLYEGADDLVRSLRPAGFLVAIASGSRTGQIARFLELKGMGDVFDAYVGADDTDEHKPKPAPYLEACRRLGVEPSRAVAVEDTVGGADAAISAGCAMVYGLPFTNATEGLLNGPATCVVGSLPKLRTA